MLLSLLNFVTVKIQIFCYSSIKISKFCPENCQTLHPLLLFSFCRLHLKVCFLMLVWYLDRNCISGLIKSESFLMMWIHRPVYFTVNMGLLFIYVIDKIGYILRVQSASRLEVEHKYCYTISMTLHFAFW